VVVAGPASYNGGQPTTVRIRNVTSNSFEVQLDEWDYLDGYHVTETISYFVMEEGQQLIDGLLFKAARVSGVASSFLSVNFNLQDSSYASKPVVLAQAVGENEPSATVVRLKDVTNQGFKVRLQQEEANTSTLLDKEVHYIALPLGEQTLGGRAFRSATVTANDDWKTVSFAQDVANPAFFAQASTYSGGDPIAVRYKNLSASEVSFKLEEEQSKDQEEDHVDEQVQYLVVETILGSSAREQVAEKARSASSTDTITETSEVTLYPNPAWKDIHVQLPAAVPATISLRNLQGSVLYNRSFKQAQQVQVAVETLPRGMYLMVIQTPNWQKVQRIMLE
jgi:hypothetical protein